MQDHERTQPPRIADERASLTAFLQYQRETLAMKCTGLATEQLRKRAVPPSELSLLGLVRHLVEVERGWFRKILNDESVRPYWPRPEPGRFGEWDVDSADPEEAFRVWHEECARSRAIVDAAGSLDDTGRYGDEVYSLRYILTHMIEEYARHNGQADLLRECIDGTTGE